MEPWLPPNHSASERSSSPQSSTQPRTRRACDRCRYMKVRCQLSVTDPDGKCSRCAKGGWTCNGALPRESPCDNAEARLKVLEDQMIAFRASLEASLRQPNVVDSFRQVRYPSSDAGAADEAIMVATNEDNFVQELLSAVNHSIPASPSVLQPYTPYLQGLEEDLEERGRNKRRRLQASPAGSISNIRQYKPSKSSLSNQEQLESPGHAHLPSPAATSSTQDHLPNVSPFNYDLDPSSYPNTLHHIPDVIDQGILTVEAAVELFNFWVSDLASVLPAVIFPQGTNPLSIRRSKPVLFLAILLAGTWVRHTGIQPLLSEEFLRVISLVHIQRGERSLELIQALQIATLWYMLPSQLDRIQIYSWINLAATMAMDIGLDKMQLLTRNEAGQSRDHLSKESVTRSGRFGTAEEIRAWLSCYYLCINGGIAYQRPSLIQWTPYMDRCEEVILNSPLVSDSDRVFCQWVRLAHISEDFQHHNMGSKPHQILEECEKRLKACHSGVCLKPGNYHLQMYEHIVLINVYEIVLRDRKPRNDVIPYTESVLSLSEESISAHLPNANTGLLTACLDSIYDLLDIFLNLDDESLSNGPIFTFSRIVYAVLVLLKIYLVSRDSGAGIDKALSRTRIELYFNATINNLGRVKGMGSSRGARMFQNTLRKFQKWLDNQPKIPLTDKGSNSMSRSLGNSHEAEIHDEQRTSEYLDKGNAGLDMILRLPHQPTTPSECSILSASDRTKTEPRRELENEEARQRTSLTTQSESRISSRISCEEDIASRGADLSDGWQSTFVPCQGENMSNLLWTELNFDPSSGDMLNNVNVMFQDWIPDLFPIL